MRNKRNATIAAVIGTVGIVVGFWLLLRGSTSSVTFPLNTLSPKGDKAQSIQDLVVPVFIVAGVIFVLVEVGVLWLITRFKRRSEDVDGVDEPVQVHGNTVLEIGWTVVPALLLAVLAVFNVQTILDVDRASDDALEITVVGQQWWWEFRYDLDDDGEADIVTSTQMVMPTGRDVVLDIQALDVIHSFWIPALNGKKDAVPGRSHRLVFQADQPGVFEGQCTEFCGLSHGVMRMQVKALPPAEYEEWLERMTTPPAQPAEDDAMALAGQELFVQQCASCHQINGILPGDEAPYTYAAEPVPDYGEVVDSPLSARNAPNLTHLMMRATFAGSLLDLYTEPAGATVVPEGEPDVNNLKRWLRNPEEVKPMDPENGQGMPNLGLNEQQIDELVAYLVTLK